MKVLPALRTEVQLIYCLLRMHSLHSENYCNVSAISCDSEIHFNSLLSLNGTFNKIAFAAKLRKYFSQAQSLSFRFESVSQSNVRNLINEHEQGSNEDGKQAT